MGRRTAGALVLLLALGARGVAADERDPASPGSSWGTSITAALAQARAQKKPVLVFCHFSRSAAAQHVRTRLHADPQVAALIRSLFVPLLLDSDALDAEESGGGAMGRFGVSWLPTHLVLDASGRMLVTIRGVPAPTPARFRDWVAGLRKDVATFEDLERRAAISPAEDDLHIALIEMRLELATRLGNVRGGIRISRPPATIHHRQIDAVIEEARRAADALAKRQSPVAHRARSLWAFACLAAERNRDDALARIDAILERLHRADAAEYVRVAFNAAHALFEEDPQAALPYLRRVIETGPTQAAYWEARVLEAYGAGRLGDADKALSLYRRIVAEGPVGNRWVENARAMVRRLEAPEDPDPSKGTGR